MTKILEQKKALRREIRIATKELSTEQRLIQSKRVWSILSQYEKFVNAKTVVFYWSMESELNTTEFIESVKYKGIAPRSGWRQPCSTQF